MSNLYIPKSAEDVPVRPLSGGMRLDLATTSLKPGEFLDLRNVQARTDGLWRRRGRNPLLSSAVTFPPISGLDTIWKVDGTQQSVVFDSKYLYYIGSAALTRVDWIYNTGTVTGTQVGGVTRLTGAGGASWTTANEVRLGDVVYCANLTGTNKYGVIRSINSATEIDLMTDEGTATAGSAYEIRRAFKAAQNKFVDAFPFKGKYLICDGNREVRYYEPYISATTYAPYSADPTFDVFPYCGCYWKDRLFFGRFIEGSTTIRNRIRWTTTLDPTVLPTLQYVDLPYTPGHIRRLMGLGNYLMCYMSDALWVGRQTNYGDQLPYAFDTRLDTGGAGLVGDRAVYPALSGHFLVLDDGIYYLSPEGKLEDIGDPIRKDFFGNPDDLWSVQVCLDPIRTRIVFSQPSSSQSFTRIWSFDFRAKAWSYDEVDATLVSLKQIWRGYTYDAWLTSGPYSYDVGLAIFPTYDSIGGGSTQDLLFGIGSYVYAQGAETLTQDNSTGNIPVTIESPDIDYDNPDKSRVHLRLSVKLKEAITEAVTFTVSVSTDRGRTWRALGGRALTISANQDENYVNFRSKGSTFRFKLESTSVCRSYCIQEFVLSKVDKGQEGHLPSNP